MTGNSRFEMKPRATAGISDILVKSHLLQMNEMRCCLIIHRQERCCKRNKLSGSLRPTSPKIHPSLSFPLDFLRSASLYVDVPEYRRALLDTNDCTE